MGTDGEIGYLDGFILDDASWHLGYLEVTAGEWLLGRDSESPFYSDVRMSRSPQFRSPKSSDEAFDR